MRVLMLTERYYPIWGGAENQLRQLIPRLVYHGCRVEVVTRRWKRNMPRYDFVDNIPVFRIGLPGYGTASTLLFVLSLICFLISRGRGADIIHSHGAVAMGVVGKVASTLNGNKNIAKIASAGRISSLKSKIFGRLLINLFRKSDGIICMTNEIYNELKSIRIPSKSIYHIPNAVDTKRFYCLSGKEHSELKTKIGFGQHNPVFIFSGRIIRGKGLRLLLESWPMIIDYEPNARLIIIGSGIGQSNSIEYLLKRKVTIEELKNIYFLGETELPETFLSIADIFLFPSRKEGFPNALLEAMACGIAIIASDIGGVTELISDGKTGILFPAGDRKILVEKIIYLLKNPMIKNKIGKQARKHVLDCYPFDKIAKRYFETYTTITKKGDRSYDH